MKYLLCFFLFLSGNLLAQNWLQVDSVFAISGVTVKGFSAPSFGDINNDGKIDLFLGNIGDKTDFFWNNTVDFPSTFTKDTSLLFNIYSGGLINTNADYPYLLDFDGDSDLDLIIGGNYGLIYYENIGSISSAQFEKNDTIFSNVNTQIGGDPKPAFGDLDNDGDYDLLVGTGISYLGPADGLTIGFRNTGNNLQPNFILDNTLASGIPDVGYNSYPALVDIENDGDLDLLIGRDGGAVFYYKNTGSPSAPIWTREYTTFANVEATTYWKNPTFADLDYDGDLDLIYGTSSGPIYVYRNNGTVTNPLFQYYPDYFRVIKVFNRATSFLIDYDNDGDNDLLSGDFEGKFRYFKNNGTNQQPIFEATTTTFTNIDIGYSSSPVFVDLDGDQDFDIVSGEGNGKLFCYINNNGTFTSNTTLFNFVSVGYSSIPTFCDIDNDGDLDLLVGAEAAANVRFYENLGNNSYQENSSFISGVSFPNYNRPTFSDVDNDGDFDLIIGRSNGSFYFYRNDGTTQLPIWTRYDELFTGVKVKQNAHAGFADLDGDGRKDIVVGEYDGNFTFFKNLFAVSSTENENVVIQDFYLSQNYPNPFNPSTKISWYSAVGSWQTLKVFDVLGNEVVTLVNEYKPAGIHEVEFSVGLSADGGSSSDIASGIYFYQLNAGNYVETKKMILIK